MKHYEINHIEKELATKLPDHYIAFISNFKGLSNLSIDLENFLYSDPNKLIEINKLFEFYLETKIVKKKLIIGDNGGGDLYLIDLINQNDKRVFVFDHEESVESFFDSKTEIWSWEKLESYESLESYENNLKDIFGV